MLASENASLNRVLAQLCEAHERHHLEFQALLAEAGAQHQNGSVDASVSDGMGPKLASCFPCGADMPPQQRVVAGDVEVPEQQRVVAGDVEVLSERAGVASKDGYEESVYHKTDETLLKVGPAALDDDGSDGAEYDDAPRGGMLSRAATTDAMDYSDEPNYWANHAMMGEEPVGNHMISKTNTYELIILVLILVNSVFMAWEVNSAAVYGRQGMNVGSVASYMRLIFCILFGADLLFRVAEQRAHFFSGTDAFLNVFDALVVVVMVADYVVQVFDTAEEQVDLQFAASLRMFRLFRLLRLLKVVRAMAMFHDFNVLMFTLRRACSALFWMVLVLMMVIHVLAIAFTEGTVGKCSHGLRPKICEHFGTLSATWLSLHEATFGGRPWSELMEDVMELDPIYPVLFFVFITFTMLVSLNLITAMVVGLEEEARRKEEAFGYGGSTTKNHELDERRFERLQATFDLLDFNGTDDVSLDEFMFSLKDPSILAIFTHLEIDVSDPKDIFQMLDRRQTGVLERDDFVLGCMRLRGTATSSTLAGLRFRVELLMSDILHVKTNMSRMVNIIESSSMFRDLNKTRNLRTARKRTHQKTSSSSVIMSAVGSVRSRSPQIGPVGPSIEKTEERAMTLLELRDVRRIVNDRCLQDKWVNVMNGALLLPEDVTLYTLNYYHISPRTVGQEYVLKGLSCGSVSPGQTVVQQHPESESHYSRPMAVGEVLEPCNGTGVRIRLLRGRFEDKTVASGARVSIAGEDAGEPTAVSSTGSFSYKEFVSSEPTPPKWYTCHWWGTTVSSFLKCLEEHTKLRKLSASQSSYWICGYANRQHDLAAEINVPDLKDTSFYKAMQNAVGVLLVLDEHATALTRIWCSFELYKTITSDNKLLDVGAMRHDDEGEDEPVVIVDGLVSREPLRAKTVRENKFPHDILVHGMDTCLESGQSYRKADIERVLAFTASDGPAGEDLETRKTIALKKANAALNAYFALAAWPWAVQQQLISGTDQHTSFVDVLKRDAERKSLTISLAHFSTVENADIADIAKALPPNLETLSMSFEGCAQITNAGLVSFTGCLPVSLRMLRLSFMGCKDISDPGIKALSQEIARLPQLQDFKLDCGMCGDITQHSLKYIANSLPRDIPRCNLLFRGTMVNREFRTLREVRRGTTRGGFMHKLLEGFQPDGRSFP